MFKKEIDKYSYMWKDGGNYSKSEQAFFMVINFVYIIITAILIFVIYTAIKAIMIGVKAKKGKKLSNKKIKIIIN